MKKPFYFFVAAVISAVILDSCCRNSAPSGDSSRSKPQKGQTALLPCIIYKTRADYDRNVPVILTDDKSKIASFPDIKDIFFNGDPAYPVKLENGFLLDNRGIGPDAAFLSYTYEEYSKLGKTPDPSHLYEKIIDKNPITEMYQCGNRSDYSDIVAELNRIISDGRLKEFRRLK